MHSPASSAPPPAASHQAPVFRQLLPLALAVFVGFLTIGLPLPVLPLHLHDTLGMGTLLVGVVIGAQFAAALLSRAWAGAMADTQGARRAVSTGFLIAASSGLAYLASLAFVTTPAAAVGLLLLGRVLLGCAESLVVTGALSWGLALIAGLGAAAPPAMRRTPFYQVLGAVWVPGMGLALSSVGFGVITAFIALLFAAREWGNASLAFTCFGLAFIGARLLFGHLPDQLGGARIALVCVVIEAMGQLLIWGADSAPLAYLGAALTGFGYSLAFPGFGVEAVRRAPPQSRGAAMGAYVAFMDISLGITGPAAGAIAGAWGVESVYLMGASAVGLSLLVAVRLQASAGREVRHA